VLNFCGHAVVDNNLSLVPVLRHTFPVGGSSFIFSLLATRIFSNNPGQLAGRRRRMLIFLWQSSINLLQLITAPPCTHAQRINYIMQLDDVERRAYSWSFFNFVLNQRNKAVVMEIFCQVSRDMAQGKQIAILRRGPIKTENRKFSMRFAWKSISLLITKSYMFLSRLWELGQINVTEKAIIDCHSTQRSTLLARYSTVCQRGNRWHHRVRHKIDKNITSSIVIITQLQYLIVAVYDLFLPSFAS